MRFSIIVPIYNAELYLNKVVKSVLSQTYKDFELILVNDGSTDNSLKLMKKLQKKDKRIKIFSKENTGPGYTRKYGYEKSSGELLFFVDSDDWITSSSTLEEIHELFENNPKIDVLFFDREDIIGDAKEVIPGFIHVLEGLHGIDEIKEVIRPGLGAKILKRKILTSEMFFESNVFEDLYTSYEYLKKCNFFYYIPKCFYSIYHEKNSNSLSSNQSAEMFHKSLKVILLIYNNLNVESLKYSLELRMATLFVAYWKARLKNEKGYDNNLIKQEIKKIVTILKYNHISIEANGYRIIKKIIYYFLLFLSR